MENNTKNKIYGRIYIDTFNSLPQEWIQEDVKGHKYFRVCVEERNVPGKYGDTHSLRVVLPDQKKAEPSQKQKMYLADLQPFRKDVNVRATAPQAQAQEPSVSYDDPFA